MPAKKKGNQNPHAPAAAVAAKKSPQPQPQPQAVAVAATEKEVDLAKVVETAAACLNTTYDSTVALAATRTLQQQASSLSALAKKQAALMALLAQFESTARNAIPALAHDPNKPMEQQIEDARQRDSLTESLLSAAEALAQMQEDNEQTGVSLDLLQKALEDVESKPQAMAKAVAPATIALESRKKIAAKNGTTMKKLVDPVMKKKVLQQLLGAEEDYADGTPEAEKLKREKRIIVRALASATAAGDEWFAIDDEEDDDDYEEDEDGGLHGGIYLDDEDDDGLVGEEDFYDPEGHDDEDDDETVDAFNEAVAEKLRKNLGGKINKGYKTVQLEQNSKGRGLVSTEDFPSRTIITACRPDIAVLYSSHVKTHCAHCYQPLPTAAASSSSSAADKGKTTANDPRSNGGGALVLDGKKKNAAVDTHNDSPARRFGSSSLQPSYYICEFCFNFSLCENCNHPHLWDDHHLPCKWFSTLPAEVQENDTDYIRFLLNYCARIQGGDRRLMYAVENLCSNEDAQRENVKKFCSSYSKLVATTFAPQGLLITQQHLYSTLLRTKSNAIGFPFDSNATLGWAVQLDICMVNHSCNPNCAITQAGNGCIELRALRPIFKEEEITIAYINIPAFPDVRTRVAHLWSEYRFKCTCDLCEEQTKTLLASGGTMPKLLP